MVTTPSRQSETGPAEPQPPREWPPPESLRDALGDGPPGRREALVERIGTLLGALGIPAPTPAADGGPGALVDALDEALAGCAAEEAWLALAVVTGRLPYVEDVRRAVRQTRLGRASDAVFDGLRRSLRLEPGWENWPPVEVLRGQVTVDLHHTSRVLFATGIQRVAREASRRWARDNQIVPVGWTGGYAALRPLSEEDKARAFSGEAAEKVDVAEPLEEQDGRAIVVPWRGTHLVPELPAEAGRAERYQAFAAWSGCETGFIGFDCVPLTVAESCADGMPRGFATFLAAVAGGTRVAAISQASAGEFTAWRHMLCGTGRAGPEIAPVGLAFSAATPSDADLAEARELLGVGSSPLVLSVGSHEPRKNHLALVEAAEVLWQEGRAFDLTLVGGNAWNSRPFEEEVKRLAEAGRPIRTIMALPDRLLWAAYRLATCTVFPSLHEGFGLPVVESLASGTPVITSGYGSMLETARHGGALFVDPRDPASLADALRRMLEDRSLRDRLAAEAASLPRRSWDDYAAEVWAYLVEGRAPSPPGG